MTYALLLHAAGEFVFGMRVDSSAKGYCDTSAADIASLLMQAQT